MFGGRFGTDDMKNASIVTWVLWSPALDSKDQSKRTNRGTPPAYINSQSTRMVLASSLLP